MLRAGRLDQRIVIQSYSTSKDAYGQDVKSWSAVATVWAAVEPLRGQEYFDAQQVIEQHMYRFVIRYRSDVTTGKYRISWNSKIFDIRSIINPGEKDVSLEIMATEQPAQ